MNQPFDQMPLWELRRCIESDIAYVRMHYGALMPPLADRPSKLMPWRPLAAARQDGAGRTGAARPAHLAELRPAAPVAERPV